MMRFAGNSLLFATLAAATACSVGGGGGGGGADANSGAGSDDPNTKNGIVCNSAFTITGTFTPGTPGRPIDPDTQLPITGCWPVGTWTFTAAVDTAWVDPTGAKCPTSPTVLPSYSFRVDRTDEGTGLVESYTNLTTLNGLQAHIAVSSNGQGCEGNFEMGSADGKDFWNMQPTLLNPAAGGAPLTALGGTGDYSEYKSDSWPWK